MNIGKPGAALVVALAVSIGARRALYSTALTPTQVQHHYSVGTTSQ